MKKLAVTIIATVLLLTLACGSALALTGDLTTKAAKAYADPEFTQPIGTIPKLTCVKVRAYGSYADIVINGVECYVHPNTLTQGKYDHNYIATAVMKKGSEVFQRPSSSAKSYTTKKKCTVYVYGIENGYMLIRNKKTSYFGFTKADNLEKVK